MTLWDKLKQFTSARVGLGRVGSALPTKRILEFQRAHAAARSAVWLPWDFKALKAELQTLGFESQILISKVNNREDYLRFPNRGRRLAPSCKINFSTKSLDFAFVVSDGLSALAVQNHFLPLWKHFSEQLRNEFPEMTYGLLLAPFSRVAIADEIGEVTKAKLSIIFVGERPGLNSPDSLGVYMTFNPKMGNSDAQRNCISNIRPPQGLDYKFAAAKLIYLMKESFRLQLSGVPLKDEFESKSLIPPKQD